MPFGKQMFTGCSREDVAPAVLLTSLEEVYEEASNKLKSVSGEVRGRGGFASRKGKYHNIEIMVMKTPIGAPATAIALEELYRLGARIFVKVDTALGLQRKLRPGTLIVPIAAVRAESVSKYYAPAEYPAIPSYKFLQVLDKVTVRGSGVEPTPTVVMSTDMFYLTVREEYERWAKLVGAVDMDTAALYTIAQVRGLHAGALLVIDSSVWSGPREEVWLEESEESVVKTREEVISTLRTAVNLGLEALIVMYEYLKSEKAIERLEKTRGQKRLVSL
ncbi:nucleoside phosphorylase [Pyrolobus fumarii]|uniref:nucleoside phosphorylase n=1 Tax=Pyrolobus fumarii TaxID=54252 RepID=UPI000689807E|nr:hypothetical protein [Pyrolobus fumarii]